MTAKRFRITDNGIEDTLLKEQYPKIKKSDEVLDSISCTHLIDLVKLLNELHEENNLLKDIIKDIVVQLDANHTSHTYQMTIPINKVIYNELKRRLKETSFNEELRRFLECL